MLPPRAETRRMSGTPPPGAAMRLCDERAPGEAAAAMLFHAVEPELAEHPGHALMRFGQRRVARERRLELRASAGDILLLAQQVGEIHSRDDIVRMMRDGLHIGSARRGSKSAGPRERSQFIERVKMRRVCSQYVDVGLLCRLILAPACERSRMLEHLTPHACLPLVSHADTLAPRAPRSYAVRLNQSRCTRSVTWSVSFL